MKDVPKKDGWTDQDRALAEARPDWGPYPDRAEAEIDKVLLSSLDRAPTTKTLVPAQIDRMRHRYGNEPLTPEQVEMQRRRLEARIRDRDPKAMTKSNPAVER